MPNRTKPITILMADDDPDDRQLTREAFEENHLANDLRFVEDGEELLDYLHQRGKYAAEGAAPTPGLILLAAPMAVVVIAASLSPGFLWKPLDPHPYDVLSYHLQIPREWFDAGKIVPLLHNSFSFFPMGMEMHDLLAETVVVRT